MANGKETVTRIVIHLPRKSGSHWKHVLRDYSVHGEMLTESMGRGPGTDLVNMTLVCKAHTSPLPTCRRNALACGQLVPTCYRGFSYIHFSRSSGVSEI